MTQPKLKYGTDADVKAIDPAQHKTWRLVISDAQPIPSSGLPLIRANSLECLARCFSQFWSISTYTENLLRTLVGHGGIPTMRISTLLGDKPHLFQRIFFNVKMWTAGHVDKLRSALLAARQQWLSERLSPVAKPTPPTIYTQKALDARVETAGFPLSRENSVE